jgi:hypothetical protein
MTVVDMPLNSNLAALILIHYYHSANRIGCRTSSLPLTETDKHCQAALRFRGTTSAHVSAGIEFPDYLFKTFSITLSSNTRESRHTAYQLPEP